MDISVIIPTYKPSDYIWKCLDSLRNQTLACDRYELIIVVNGCCEPYLSQIRDYLVPWPQALKTTVVQTDVAGVSNARNVGIDLAKGDYLAFIDDDDWVSPNYLYNLLSKVDTSSVSASNVLLIDEATGQTMDYFLTNAYTCVAHMKNPSFFDVRSFLSPPVCKLIPKAIIGDDRFPTDFALGEDSIFIFTISKRIKDVRFADVDTIYYVRYRNTSVSHRHYTYWFGVKLAIRTSVKSICIYIKSPFDYDLKLFLSRIAATLMKLFWRSYQ